MPSKSLHLYWINLTATTFVLFTSTILTSALLPRSASAFEEDLHYYATFALALTSGWSWEESEAIAGADIALDMNENLVAKLHFLSVDTITGVLGLHQAAENYIHHCFSHEKDYEKSDSADDFRNSDVRENLRASRPLIDRNNSKVKLYRIGAYLHCQQDSWSHNGYGGNVFGHVWDSFFGANPDRPSQRPVKTRHALLEAYKDLTGFYKERSGITVPPADVVTLIKAIETNNIEDADTKDQSGLRYHCNKLLTEYWLYTSLEKYGGLERISPLYLETVALARGSWQRECLQQVIDPESIEIRIIRMPKLRPLKCGIGLEGFDCKPLAQQEPSYGISYNTYIHKSMLGELDTFVGSSNAEAAPSLSTQMIGQFDYQLKDVSVTEKELRTGNQSSCLYKVEATVRNGGTYISSPAFLLSAIVPGPETTIPQDQLTTLGHQTLIEPLLPGFSSRKVVYILGKHLCPDWEFEMRKKNAFWIRIQAPPIEERSEMLWGDADITNNIVDAQTKLMTPLPGNVSPRKSVPLIALSLSGVVLSLIGLILIFTSIRLWYVSVLSLLTVCMVASVFLVAIAWFLQQARLVGDFNFLGATSNPFYSPLVPTSLLSFNLLCYGMIASMTIWSTLQSKLRPLRLGIFSAIWLAIGYGCIVYLNLPTVVSQPFHYLKSWIVADYASGVTLHLLPGITAVTVLWLLSENDTKLIPPTNTPYKHVSIGYVFLWVGAFCVLNSSRIIEGEFGLLANRFVLIASISSIITGLIIKALTYYKISSETVSWEWIFFSCPFIGIVSAFPSAGLGDPYFTAAVMGAYAVWLVTICKSLMLPYLGNHNHVEIVIIQALAGTWGFIMAAYVSAEEYNRSGFNGNAYLIVNHIVVAFVLWITMSLVATAILFAVGDKGSRDAIMKKLLLIFGSVEELLRKIAKAGVDLDWFPGREKGKRDKTAGV